MIFSKTDLQSIVSSKELNINRIEIIKTDGTVLGHIMYSYTDGEYGQNVSKCAILYVHTDISNNKEKHRSGWSYYADTTEKPTTMLIPPNEHLEEINSFKKPVLFVHGVSGSYPYWGYGIIKDFDSDYNAWQFYYPYDGPIDTSGILLGRAITKINTDYGDSVSIVAHSMGGLVTRSYIQSSLYALGSINKLLMLGTPNHGSYSAYKVYYSGIGSYFAEIFAKKDKEAPAYAQMSPGSNFVINLNSSTPRNLGTNNLDQQYLVIAGTKNCNNYLLNVEIFNQDDGLVSVSSASLLDFKIPLATINYGHTHIKGIYNGMALNQDMSQSLLIKFLNDDYSPVNISNEVNGLWTSYYNVLKSDVTLTENAKKWGILVLKIPGSTTNTLYPSIKENVLILTEKPYMWRSTDWQLEKNNSLEENYFSRSDQSYGIGCLLENKTYKVVFEKTFNDMKDGKPFAKEDTLPYTPMQTTIGQINLTSGQLTILNSNPNSNGGVSPQPIAKQNQSNQFVLKELKKISTDASVIEQEYLVDALTDSVVFYINIDSLQSGFENNNLQLISPTGTIITPASATVGSGIEYQQDDSLCFAFYFVAKPEPGTWKIQYNSALTAADLMIPILSTVDVSMRVLDSVFVKNQPIHLEATLADSLTISSSQAKLYLYLMNASGETLTIIDSLTLTNGAMNTFSGVITPTLAGRYYLTVNFQGTVNGQDIKRTLAQTLSINSVQAPFLGSPLDGAKDIMDTVSLCWNPIANATEYRVQVFTTGNEAPSIDTSITSSTELLLQSLNKSTSYLWRVASIGSSDTSSWTNIRMFSTMVDYPPTPPQHLIVYQDGNITSLSWEQNLESDFKMYRIYLDTISLSPRFVDSLFNRTDTVKEYIDLPSGKMYYFHITAIDSMGNESPYSNEDSVSYNNITSVYDKKTIIPKDFGLYQNYPNPFNPNTTIEYALPVRSQVKIEIFNLLGQRVAQPIDGIEQAGQKQIVWQARNVSSGIYFIRIQALSLEDRNRKFLSVKKMMLLK